MIPEQMPDRGTSSVPSLPGNDKPRVAIKTIDQSLRARLQTWLKKDEDRTLQIWIMDGQWVVSSASDTTIYPDQDLDEALRRFLIGFGA